MYIEEQRQGLAPIEAVPTSIAAFVGRAPMGSVGEPVSVNSYVDYERLFGGLASDYPLSYAVQDFFLNGGSQAIVLRLFEPASGQDSGVARLEFADAGFVLLAASPGAWGNALTATVDREGIADAASPQFHLTLTLQRGKDARTERFLSVMTSGDAPSRVDRVLQAQSNLARVERLSTLLPANGATARGVGGNDGARLSPATYMGGLAALDKTPIFNLLCIPPDARMGGGAPDLDASVRQAAAAYCARRRAVYIVDPPAVWAEQVRNGRLSAITPDVLGIAGVGGRNAAVYFPCVWREDPLNDNRPALFSPCGMIAGVIAATDAAHGVWKAPAGQNAALAGVVKLDVNLSNDQNGRLNSRGINSLRTFPQYGSVVWSARTLRGADALQDEYKYVPVRRLVLFIEESVFSGTKWAVFEPNDETLWSNLRLCVGTFLTQLYRQGAFYQYAVRCDATRTTQADVDRGIVNILIEVAPIKPAEFVVIQVQQSAAQPSS